MNIDPILARQVELNATDIEALSAVLSGVSMDVNKDTNSPPSSYTSSVTYEIKSRTAVALTNIDKFSGIDYVYIHTYKSNSTTITLKAYQQAYAIDAENAIVTAYRVANADGSSWGTWMTGLAQNAGGSGGGGSVVGPDQPPAGDQDTGDFWYEPITAVNI